MKLTRELVEAIVELAKASTPGLNWGPCEKITGEDFENQLSYGEGPVWFVWTTRPDGIEVYAAMTGNGPTSEANAKLFAHAREIIIALGEEYLRDSR